MKQKRMDLSLALEKWYPFVVSVFVGMIYMVLNPEIKDDPDTILNMIINVVSILIGFLSALLALLLSLSTNIIVKEIFKGSHYKRLMRKYFEKSICAGFVLIALTTMLLLRKTISEWNISIIRWIEIFWVVMTMFFFTSAFRVIFIVMKIVFFDDGSHEEIKETTMTSEEQKNYEDLKNKRVIKKE